jgi:hypothetical protein
LSKIEETIEGYGYANIASQKDDWNVYCLEDGTIIKQKVVPLKFIKKGDDYIVNSTVLTVAFSEKKGNPSTVTIPTTEAEIMKVVEQPDIPVTYSKEPWNEYMLDDGTKILIRSVAIAIASTGLFDERGERVYFVNQQVFVKKQAPHKLLG